MIPDYVLSTEPQGGELLYPDNVETTALYDLEMGGVALNDPNQGLDLKAWIAVVEPSVGITLEPVNKSQPKTLQVPGVDISFVSLAFDTNMQPAIVYVQAGVTKFRWFDTTIPAFVTSEFSGVRSPRAATDDKRGLVAGTTDVILAYIKANKTLAYRMQRERYTVERDLKSGIPDDVFLKQMGMNTAFRFQFELRLK